MPEPAFRFEEFELDVGSCELKRAGHPVKLERIPMELLILLLQNSGRLVRREEINKKLWGSDVFVETEHSINTAVNKLRAILRDDSRDPRFIRTVVGRGYCFIAKVGSVPSLEIAPIVDSASPLHADPELLPPASGSFKADSASFQEGVAAAGSLGIVAIEPQTHPTSNSSSVRADTLDLAKKRRIPRLIIPLFLLLVVAAAVYLLFKNDGSQQPKHAKSSYHSLAVLPFRNLGQGSDEDYLVDGMTDQLITDLGKSSVLRVISYGSVMQYKGVQKSIREIARELNVGMIVEGSYLRAGQKVRITAQLLDARNGRHLWEQTYEESDTDLLAMQDQITDDIAHQVSLSLGGTFSAASLRNVDPQARDAYLRGRYLWNQRTSHSLMESVRYYTEAIRADPNYADAYAALAESYVLLSIYSDTHPSESLLKAEFAAERALQLDNRLGQAHTALAAVKTDRDWDWAGAGAEYRRALQLSPGDPTAHHWYSLHLSRLGKFQEAKAEMDRAIALDPLSLIINTDAAETAYWARDPHDAMKRVDGVLALNPGFAQAHLIRGKILVQLRRYREAQVEFTEAGRLFGGKDLVSLQGHALALGGSSEQALKMARDLETLSAQTYVSGVHISQIYCALHRTDDAMKWLGRAYQQHDTGINMLRVEPLFDGCRADPRFNQLLRDLKLVP